MHDTHGPKPMRHTVQVDEYIAPRTPADGAPDGTRVFVQWQEGDGTPITDPERIAELEARLEEYQKCHS